MPLSNFKILLTLHENSTTKVYRAIRKSDHKKVIIKELKYAARTAHMMSTFINEQKILDKLKHKNIIHLIDVLYTPTEYLHIFEDIEADSLFDLVSIHPFSLKEALKISLDLAKVLQLLHNNQILHSDINPKNIIYNPNTSQLQLIDFGNALHYANKTLLEKPNDTTSANLFYISPEQTGLTTYTIDERSDLYSFGMTLYHLFLGHSPFEAIDRYELFHKQIALRPKPLHERRSNFPPVLSHIISKLIEKNPFDRYQNDESLIHDLQSCLAGLSPLDTIEAFPIARYDHPPIEIGEHLYGRETELKQLKKILSEALLLDPVRLFISGDSGIGKTRLAEEFFTYFSPHNVAIVRSKFEQLNDPTPYFSFKQLFSQLYILLMSQLIPNNLSELSAKNMALLRFTFNELSPLFSKTKKTFLHDLGDMRTQLPLAVKEFFNLVATREKPLILFIDDLQWADEGSVRLIKEGLFSSQNPYLHLICSYRSSELSHNASANQLVVHSREQGSFQDINLQPLTQDSVSTMLQELFHKDSRSLEKLSEVLYTKTNGNPFYIKTFIQFLIQKNELYYQNGEWGFSIKNIQKHNASVNLVSLIMAKFKSLSKQQQSCLQYLSILGSNYRLDLSEQLLTTLGFDHDMMHELEKKGFITLSTTEYQFVHDQLQLSIYAGLDDQTKRKLHYHIAHILEDAYKAKTFHDILKLTYHFDHAYPEGRYPQKLFAYNICAIEQTLNNNAYEAALKKVEWVHHTLFDKTLYKKHPKLCFDYLYLRSKTFYLNALSDKAYAQLQDLLPLAKKREQRLLSFKLFKDISVTQGKHFHELVHFGNELLLDLGLNVPHDAASLKESVDMLLTQIQHNPLHHNPKEILKLKHLDDAKLRKVMSLLVDYWEAAYYLADIDLMQWSALNIINTSFHHGNTSESCFAYVLYGAQLSNRQEYKKAADFAQVALKLNHDFDDRQMLPKVYNFVANFINPYTKSFSSNIPLYEKSLHQSKLNGDIIFGTWANFLMHFSDFLSGNSLDELQQHIDQESQFILNSGDEKMIAIFNQLRYTINALQAGDSSFDYDEKKALELWTKEQFYPALSWYAIIKAQEAFLGGMIEQGLEYLDTYALTSENEVIMFPKIRLHFIRALLYFGKKESLSVKEQTQRDDDIQICQTLAKTSPKQFRFGQLLLKAESMKSTRSLWDVAKMYDKALKAAHTIQNPLFIGLVGICAKRFFDGHHLSDLSHFYFKEAVIGLEQWGAYSCVRQLRESDQKELETNIQTALDSIHLPIDKESSFTNNAATNWQSLLKSFNAISQSNSSSELIYTLMQIILENATASKASLVLKEGEKFKLKAQIDFETEEVKLCDLPMQENSSIPYHLLSYVINTQKNLILQYPAQNSQFQVDPYIKKFTPVSCLSIPVLLDGSLRALLYIENRFLVTLFDEEKIKTLELLLTQAMIIFQNTSLLENLKQSEEKLNKAQEIAHVGSWQYNSETKDITWSAETYRIYNLEPFSIEINGDWFFQHLYPDDMVTISQAVEKSLSTHAAYDVRHTILTADNQEKFVHQRGEVFLENGVKFITGTIQDITQAQASKQQIMRLSQVVDQSPFTTIITDLNGIIEYTNTQTTLMTGYTQEELIGHKMSIFRSDMHTNEFYAELWHVIKDKKQIWKGQLFNRMKDGKTIDCFSTIFPILNTNNEPMNFVTIQEDVTQQNLKDKLLLMQTRQAQMGEMLSMIAHQWRQPLSIINALVHSQRINLLLNQIDTEELSKCYDDIETQIEYLTRTITDFRDFFRPDKESMMTNSSTIISKALNLLEHSINQQGVEIRLNLTSESDYRTFEHEVEQVILNLIKNAQDVFKERDIKEPCIYIGSAEIKDEAIITIEDNAKGISKDVLDTLFLPYISTKSQKHGTGLGLYMSKTIIEDHCKGKLFVTNTPLGAKFTISIPLSEASDV